jgi:hypothetical protein
MLATAGSTIAAIDILRDHGVNDIVFMCLLAAPEGVERLRKAHPDVPIFTAALDRQLNEKGYILPGLGDVGDRIYGTQKARHNRSGQNRRHASKPRLVSGHACFVYMLKLRQGCLLKQKT